MVPQYKKEQFELKLGVQILICLVGKCTRIRIPSMKARKKAITMETSRTECIAQVLQRTTVVRQQRYYFCSKKLFSVERCREGSKCDEDDADKSNGICASTSELKCRRCSPRLQPDDFAHSTAARDAGGEPAAKPSWYVCYAAAPGSATSLVRDRICRVIARRWWRTATQPLATYNAKVKSIYALPALP